MTRVKANFIQALRRIAALPCLLPVTALLLRARTVRPTSVFVMRVVLRRKGIFIYRLRLNGLRVSIRHGTGDVITLGEVFHDQYYRPIREVEDALKQVERIVDLGANIGLFGAFAASRWPHAEILAFEPDPANATVHEQTIALNKLQARCSLVRAAAGAHDGSISFVSDNAALSREAGPDDDANSIQVEMEDVIPRLAQTDLLKMDIEGGEWAILKDPRFGRRPPRVLVLEYHPRFCDRPDPGEAARSALEAAGMHVKSIWHREDGHGMLWAWQT